MWQLSGTATRRFFNLPYARYMLPVPGRQMIVRVMSFTTLAWGGWLANGRGTAVCGLTGARAPRRRLAAVAVCVVAGVAVLAGWVTWVALWAALGLIVIPVLTFVGFGALMLMLGWRAARVGKARSQLAKLNGRAAPPAHGPLTCPTQQVEVHMVASEEPGAGRRSSDRGHP